MSEHHGPENQAPENQAPENQAPENQAPENQAPENQAPAPQAGWPGADGLGADALGAGGGPDIGANAALAPVGGGALALDEGDVYEVVSAETRLSQLAESNLSETLAGDPDEALFEAAFGQADIDGDIDADVPVARPQIPALFQLPEAAVAAMADAAPVAALAAPQDGGPGLPAVDPRHALGMRQMAELPGYFGAGRLAQSTRALGRKIFSSLPCFGRMAEASRVAGHDPLGQVWVLANIDPGNIGGQPDPAAGARIDALHRWITDNAGLPLDAGVMRFPAMPGYSANVLLYATENETYLVVQEEPRIGAPVAASYIYSWLGGRAVYRLDNNADRPLSRLARPDERGQRHILVEHVPIQRNAFAPPQALLRNPYPNPAPLPAAPVHLLPAQPPAQPQAQAAPAQAAPAQAPQAQAAPAQAAPAQAPQVQGTAPGRANAAPPPPPPPPPPRPLNAIQALRAAGFLSAGTDEGPALKQALPDGSHVLVLGEGRSLSLASSFSVRLMTEAGEEIERMVAPTAGAVIEWMDARKANTPAP